MTKPHMIGFVESLYERRCSLPRRTSGFRQPRTTTSLIKVRGGSYAYVRGIERILVESAFWCLFQAAWCLFHAVSVDIETDLDRAAVAQERRHYFRRCRGPTLHLLHTLQFLRVTLIPLRETERDTCCQARHGARKCPPETSSALSVDILHFALPLGELP